MVDCAAVRGKTTCWIKRSSILVVIDEPDIQDMVAIMLEEPGYDVLSMGDGAAKSSQMPKTPPSSRPPATMATSSW
jgi:hypothetical protein